MLYAGQELEEFVGKWNPKCKDLSGAQIGKWFVICRGPNSPSGHSRFWSQCQCGRVELRHASHFRRGKSSSCTYCAARGLTPPKRKEREQDPNRVSKGYFSVISSASRSSRDARRGQKFDITRDYLWKLFLEQDGKCALSGVELTLTPDGRRQTASLDRVDCGVGYVRGNVQWVHKDVNRMKNVYPQPHFIETCAMVAQKKLGVDV